MLHMVAPHGNRLLGRSVTPFLGLVTPFAIFVHHQQYGFARPEIVIALLACAALALLLGVGAGWSSRFEVATIAALLTWFADIQLQDPGAKRLVALFIVLCVLLWALRDHAAQIVSLMMATVLAASLQPTRAHAVANPLSPPARVAASRPHAARSNLPLIVHLVLDEHIGLEGLPRDLTATSFKEDTRSLFVDRGFRLFGSAYSEHGWTVDSLGHLLNLTSGRYVSGLTTAGPKAGKHRLTRNAYFERLEQEGYAIRVHHPDYLDVCAGRVASCHAYSETSLRVLHDLPVPTREKLAVVAGSFLQHSEAVDKLKGVYGPIRQRLLRADIHLPAWTWDRNIVAPVATMRALDTIAADLARSQPGDLFFAHLLIPHFPYVYNADCQARLPSEWLHRRGREGVDGEPGDINTRDSRAIRYALYFQQIRCVQRKIDQLIGAIPSPLWHDAFVIIQGDHGSRIGMVDASSLSESSFTVTDYADFFSTLFAVRSPQLEAGYDRRPASVTCLLRTLVESRFTSMEGLSACSSSKVVFFKDKTRHVLPDFTAPVPPAATVGPAAH
jgi:hypothetical protein